MGEKFWIQDFETGLDRLRIHFVTEHGRVTSAIVHIKKFWRTYRQIYEGKYEK